MDAFYNKINNTKYSITLINNSITLINNNKTISVSTEKDQHTSAHCSICHMATCNGCNTELYWD